MVKQGEKRGRYKRHVSVAKAPSGYRGVYKNKSGRFVARLSLRSNDNKSMTFYVGIFDSAKAAHNARIRFINKLK